MMKIVAGHIKINSPNSKIPNVKINLPLPIYNEIYKLYLYITKFSYMFRIQDTSLLLFKRSQIINLNDVAYNIEFHNTRMLEVKKKNKL